MTDPLAAYRALRPVDYSSNVYPSQEEIFQTVGSCRVGTNNIYINTTGSGLMSFHKYSSDLDRSVCVGKVGFNLKSFLESAKLNYSDAGFESITDTPNLSIRTKLTFMEGSECDDLDIYVDDQFLPWISITKYLADYLDMKKHELSQ